MTVKKLAALSVVLLLTLLTTRATAQSFEDCASLTEDMPTLIEPENNCEQTGDENDSSSSDTSAEPMEEPETAEPSAPIEPTEMPTPDANDQALEEPAEEAPLLVDVKFFDADGRLLKACQVERGKTLEWETYPCEAENFMGWCFCDESGAYADTVPYDFSRSVEESICLRARLIEDENADHTVPKEVFVTAHCDAEVLSLGSRITLTATLVGYEGLDYLCRWQYADADRNGSVVGEWQDAKSGEMTFSYVLTDENLLTAWRMRVTQRDESSI